MPHILQHLDFVEFCELNAACDLYNFSLVPYVRSNTKLKQKILFDNYFDQLIKTRPSKEKIPVLNYERLWELSAEDLLIEVRVLSNGSFDGVFPIDMIAVDNCQRPACIPMVAFNPVYPVAAIAEYNSLMVVAYGGPIRTEKGQIIYSTAFHSFGENVWFSWNPLGTCLLSCVQYTEPGNTKTLSLYKLYPDSGIIRHLHTPGLELKGRGATITSSIWVSDESFIWCQSQDTPLLLITVTKRNEVVVKTLLDPASAILSVNLDDLALSRSPIRGLGTLFGNLFAVPDSRSPHYFCVVKCPSHAGVHHCIGVVSRASLRLQALINLPGHVLEVGTVEDKLFVLYTKLRCLIQTDLEAEHRLRSDLTNCPYKIASMEQIRNYEKTSELVYFTDSNLEPKNLTATGELVEIYHNRTPADESDPIGFSRICNSTIMNPTKHFVQLINIGEAVSLHCATVVWHERIYVHHGLMQKMRQCYPPYVHGSPVTIFYHPTKPIQLTHRYSLYNEFDRPFFSVTPAAKLQDLAEVKLYDELQAPYNTPITATVTST